MNLSKNCEVFERKSADFEKWKKRDLWRVSQAVFLVMGREPPYPEAVFKKHEQISMIYPEEDRKQFGEIYPHVKIALRRDKLKKMIPQNPNDFLNQLVFPHEVLLLIKQKGFKIPNELLSALGDKFAFGSENSDFPSNMKWEELTWVFLSNELVRIKVKDITKKYMFSDLGFVDRRKGDTPDTRWAILKRFAENNGEINWQSKIDKKDNIKMTAAVRDIRKKLKVFFNIADDPFYPYTKSKSYKTKFIINDNRHTESTDNSESEGFSLEEIKEHLNDPS